MLAGKPPLQSSYDEHEHLFGQTVRAAFEAHPSLYANSVGMNIWHFQCTAKADKAPKPLLDYCEGQSRDIVWAMRPEHVLCFGRSAFDALIGKDDSDPVPSTKSRVARRGNMTLWYVPHPTGRWTAGDAQHALPIVLAQIAA